jgi:atypical dual specificity phosphatase
MPHSEFTWIRQGVLAVAPRPRGVGALMRLRDAGFRAIVSLTSAPLPRSELDECGIVSLHLPVEDFTPPTIEQIQAFEEFAHEQASLDHPILVHCTAGQGRSGTMAACWLVSRGLDAEAAITDVRRHRPGAVETVDQEQMVQAWANHLRSRSHDH